MSNNNVVTRRSNAFDEIDRMPGPLRECVHEFGFAIVHQCRELGVKDPRHIRQLVNVIWQGARSPQDRVHQRNGAGSAVLNHLDWLLIQCEAGITAATLVRILAMHNMVIVPREPSPTMVDASCEAVQHMGLVSKKEKHKGRLKAAIEASSRRLWPSLYS